MTRTIKLLLLADTHARHRELDLSLLEQHNFDVLVHAGDICKSVGLTTDTVLQQNAIELMDFARWMQDIPIKHKVVIAGNHDFIFEHLPDEARMIMRTSGITYLENSGVELEGLKFYGSPDTPWFGGMAFNGPMRETAKGPMRLTMDWDHIPLDTDVLVTHGPPQGILDGVWGKGRQHQHTGCPTLRSRVHEVNPRLHVFGHIHSARGAMNAEKFRSNDPADPSYNLRTDFYNCALVNYKYQLKHKPMTAEITIEREPA